MVYIGPLQPIGQLLGTGSEFGGWTQPWPAERAPWREPNKDASRAVGKLIIRSARGGWGVGTAGWFDQNKILSGTPMMIGLSLQPTKNARFCLQHRRRR